MELAEYSRSKSLLEASIGMATINSLIDIEESKYIEKNAFEIILEKGQGKNVTMVGHFPWIPKLREKVQNLWVLEQRLREGDLPAKEAERILPQCDVVGNNWDILYQPYVRRTFEPVQKSLLSS